MNRDIKRLLEDVARGEIGPAVSARAKRLLSPRRSPRRKERAPGPTNAQRKATKRQSDAEVYEAVRERDGGYCTVGPEIRELTACMGALQIDHQWGRGKAPTRVANCRLLCERHHRHKTDSHPTRYLWLRDFYFWANARDYDAEADRAWALMALERAQHPEHKEASGG